MSSVERGEVPMLGDHPALDFLNTLFQVDGELVDSLQSGGDVLRWLARAGWPMEDEAAGRPPDSLLDMARALHGVRSLVLRPHQITSPEMVQHGHLRQSP